MKKIQDYITPNGDFEIVCENSEEFDAICKLISEKHPAIGLFGKYNTVYLYENGYGWHTPPEKPEFRLEAKDFLSKRIFKKYLN